MKPKNKTLFTPMCAVEGESQETIKARYMLNRELAKIAEETGVKINYRSGYEGRMFYVLSPTGKWLKVGAGLKRDTRHNAELVKDMIVTHVRNMIVRAKNQHCQIHAIKRLETTLAGLVKGVSAGPTTLRITKPGNMVPVLAVKAETAGHTYTATLTFNSLTAPDIAEMVGLYGPWWKLDNVIDITEGI